jgi:hypothetical protein
MLGGAVYSKYTIPADNWASIQGAALAFFASETLVGLAFAATGGEKIVEQTKTSTMNALNHKRKERFFIYPPLYVRIGRHQLFSTRKRSEFIIAGIENRRQKQPNVNWKP